MYALPLTEQPLQDQAGKQRDLERFDEGKIDHRPGTNCRDERYLNRFLAPEVEKGEDQRG